MQVTINKKTGRQVKLTKRERDLLADASRLLAEIASVTTHETAEHADAGSAECHAVLTLLGKLPLIAAEADL